MTPLTHAAVGAVIFQKLRIRKLGPLGWGLAFLLALASHYLLDAIPHFEEIGQLRYYGGGLIVFVGLGFIGVIFSVLLLRRNREAGCIWLVLSVWVALGNPAHPLLRLTTAIVGLAWLAWRTRRAEAVGCLMAGMLAVAPDLTPAATSMMERLHSFFHYQVDWGTLVHLAVLGTATPAGGKNHLEDPYFLTGYALELLFEGFIFFGALYLLYGQLFSWSSLKRREAPPREMGGVSKETVGDLG
ncbi:MAG: hypothetical protein HY649_01370 [Acidobacteria bacterium]|nr:hypothetical protein [Acidobacteriota bacterium]